MAQALIRHIDDDLMDRLKSRLGEKTAAKALIAAAEEFFDLERELFAERRRADELAEQLRSRHELLQRLAPLCLQLAELSGQDDLFVEYRESRRPGTETRAPRRT